MGAAFSDPLVEQGEITAHIQREDFLCAGKSGEPARFNEPRPYHLQHLSDDSWAALTLRVDPLARKILDIRRMYLGVFVLLLFIVTVFSTTKPTVRMQDLDSFIDDDSINKLDDFHLYIGDDDDEDDVMMNEIRYRRKELMPKLKIWKAMYTTIGLLLFISSTIATFFMERRNVTYDEKITDVCAEISPRFKLEGFKVDYRTHPIIDIVSRLFFPERVIVFTKIRETMIEETRSYEKPHYNIPPDSTRPLSFEIGRV